MDNLTKRWVSRYLKSQLALVVTTLMTGIFTLMMVLYIDSRIQVIPSLF